jgi:hypothetical protein
MKATLTSLLFATLATACGPSDSSDPYDDLCSEEAANAGKCDKPRGTLKEMCTNARVPAMDNARPHFTDIGVRWSCRDVNGVSASSNTLDDRGQEYCEYFTMLHANGIPEVITNEQGPVFCDESTPCAAGTCDTSIFSCVSGTTVDTTEKASVLGKNLTDGVSVTGLDPKLTSGQLEWLTQNPSAKVGECVFTSWHADITRRPTSTEQIAGFGLNARTPGKTDPLFRMAVGFNSNGAAQALVNDCLKAGDKKFEDGFERGCNSCGHENCVPWRKSDPSVCTMAMRVAECGCTVSVKTTSGSMKKLDLAKSGDLAIAKELFVPKSRRGFALGTWDNIDQLPSGCRYVETGDPKTITVNGVTIPDERAGRALVSCDLLGSHITSATAKDPKEACRTAYGDDVVVHVRAPTPDIATLSCDTSKPQCAGVPWDFENL